MKTKLLALAFIALSASAQTFTCAGCTDYGQIKDTGYTMQYGARMVWMANLEPGAYLVNLTFVEPVYTTRGQRPLNVWVNDAPVLTAFDVIAAVGPLFPVIWHTPTIDAGGKITVVLTANNTGPEKNPITHNAIITAISATKLTGGGLPPPAPTITRYGSVEMVQRSDKSFTPAVRLSGRIVVSSLQVFRNGILQKDNTEYRFDSSDSSVRFVEPVASDDTISISVDTQQ